jgi:UDP-N-acetylglucosamine 4,6-dehydratase
MMETGYDLTGKTILITGGTGSFGKKFVTTVLENYAPKKLIIFSRDELKQFEMHEDISTEQFPAIRYFLGDIRDRDRLYRALNDVDVVVHAAALKQVPAAEYNPFEFVKTNVIGTQNLIDAAIDCGVERVIGLSTDKAANPINLYGATKLCADKLFIAANAYTGTRRTRFAVVRYGNVVGSRGSVIPFFLKKKKEGKIPITDPEMTRFFITLDQGVGFVLKGLERMSGGELYVPKIPSMRIADLATAVAPDCEHEVIGIRPGEKVHELMIAKDDARRTVEFDDHYVIEPVQQQWWDAENPPTMRGGKRCADDFEYTSDQNDRWLTIPELRGLADQVENGG